MTTTTKRKMESREAFKEVFWNHEKKPVLSGIFSGIITKKLDGEEREFACINPEDGGKPVLAGGRDLLNKLTEDDHGKYVEIEFLEKDVFTPKGTKKKVPINRFRVSVEV